MSQCPSWHDTTQAISWCDLNRKCETPWPSKKKLIDDNHNINIPIINYNPSNSPTKNVAIVGHHPFLDPHVNTKGNGKKTSTAGPEKQSWSLMYKMCLCKREQQKGQLLIYNLSSSYSFKSRLQKSIPLFSLAFNSIH
jgi:hypothetical protein